MPDLSVAERIALEVKKRLGLISVENGYSTDTTGVVRPTRTGSFRPKDYQILVMQGNKTKNRALSCPGNPPAQAWNLPFWIQAELIPQKSDSRPADSIRNEFEADAIQALTTTSNGSDWAQWEDLAIESEISSVEPYTDDGGSLAGFQLQLIVIYRVSENNPREVRG